MDGYGLELSICFLKCDLYFTATNEIQYSCFSSSSLFRNFCFLCCNPSRNYWSYILAYPDVAYLIHRDVVFGVFLQCITFCSFRNGTIDVLYHFLINHSTIELMKICCISTVATDLFLQIGSLLLPCTSPPPHIFFMGKMYIRLKCKIWGFHGSDYEEWCLLGCYAMWLL
jgi:hypothetical protein